MSAGSSGTPKPEPLHLSPAQLLDASHAAARMTGVPSICIVLSGVDNPYALVSHTDSRSEAGHGAQIVLAQGPTVHALSTSEPVMLEAPAVTKRWPFLAAEFDQLGICRAWALPLLIGAVRLGCMTLYESRIDAMPLVRDALAAAADATQTVLELQAALITGGENGPFNPNMISVVHQATGVVSVHRNSSLIEALALLRAVAFSEGVPLEDLSREILSGRRRL